MNEQELIIQGNQASVLMPKLKRYIDEQIAALSAGVASKAYVDGQIAALAERDKDTLFINFSDVAPFESQILLYISDAEPHEMQVYTDAHIPEDSEFPPDDGHRRPIAQGIYDKYHESYPWLEEYNAAKKVVDGYIVLVPVDSSDIVDSIKDTPWLRLGYSPYTNETDVIEQHLGWIRRLLGDDSGLTEDLISEPGFLNSATIYLDEEGLAPGRSRTFCLKGWMLLKNS